MGCKCSGSSTLFIYLCVWYCCGCTGVRCGAQVRACTICLLCACVVWLARPSHYMLRVLVCNHLLPECSKNLFLQLLSLSVIQCTGGPVGPWGPEGPVGPCGPGVP